MSNSTPMGLNGYARRVAVHRLAQLARYAGVDIPEDADPAPIPPLAPKDPRVLLDIVMLVLEARRNPARRSEILGALIAWIASNLPPSEAGRAASSHIEVPRGIPGGIKGLVRASIAYSRTPTLENAAILAYIAARESRRPCVKPKPSTGEPGRVRLYAAASLLIVTAASSLLLGPVEALLVTLSAAVMAAIAVYALEGPWRRAEGLWDSCRLTRLQVLPLIEALAG